MSSARPFPSSVAILAASLLLLPASLTLPEQAAAAPAMKTSKSGTSSRRLSVSGANSARNSAARTSRAASGRSATKVQRSDRQQDGSSNWRQPPAMPADLKRAIANGVVLKPIPVKLPNGKPGELKPTRHKMREYKPGGLGKVVDTKPLTQAERDLSAARGNATLYSERIHHIDRYMRGRNSSASRESVLSDLKAKLNAANAQIRAASGRSATSVTGGVGQSGPESPSNWQRPKSFPVTDKSTSFTQLKSTPAPIADSWTTTPRLKISTHKTQNTTSSGSGG